MSLCVVFAEAAFCEGFQADYFPMAVLQVENYVPGKLAEMGLGYEDCKAINPGIVYASISGYGQSGPYRQNPVRSIFPHPGLQSTDGLLRCLLGLRRNDRS